MKIILADSHGPIMGKDQTSASLSLLYLGSYLHKQVHDCHFQYIPQVKPKEFHLEQIRNWDPDVYAVSFTSYSARVTYQMIREIKHEFPDLPVVCGGPHAMHAPEEVLLETGADICVIGEGEVTFHEIVSNLEQLKERRSGIKGIVYREDGRTIRTPIREVIDNLDCIPPPLRDLVNDSDFCGLTYSKARPNTEMVVTRGCPLRCVFCANPVFRLKNGPPYRARSPENIAVEVEDLYRRGYRESYIHSDELNVKLDWSIDVCKAIAALGHKDLYFQCNLRVVPMSEELAQWLKKANFWNVRVGVESTSNRVLKGIKKQMSFQKTEETLGLLRKHGIKVFAFLMLFNFWEENGKLQHETKEEVAQTIKDMYRLWLQGKLNYTSWAFACPVQGAEFYDIALRHGLIGKNFYPNDQWDAYKYLTNVTKAEFNVFYAKARRQQGLMALASGHFEWRNWKGIARKAMTMVRGRPNS